MYCPVSYADLGRQLSVASVGLWRLNLASSLLLILPTR